MSKTAPHTGRKYCWRAPLVLITCAVKPARPSLSSEIAPNARITSIQHILSDIRANLPTLIAIEGESLRRSGRSSDTQSRCTYDGKERISNPWVGSPGRVQLDQRRRTATIFLAKRFLVFGLSTLVACLFPVRRANLGNPTRVLRTE